MFNKRSAYIYTALTNIEGLFIRKQRWDELIKDHDTLANYLKRNILLDYLINIRIKVNVNKKKSICLINNRHDQQMLKISELKDNAAHVEIIKESLRTHINKRTI